MRGRGQSGPRHPGVAGAAPRAAAGPHHGGGPGEGGGLRGAEAGDGRHGRVGERGL